MIERYSKIYLKSATERDIPELMAIEEKVWPEEMRATKGMLLSRIKTFSEGFLCVIKDGKIQGFVCSEIINYKDTKKRGFNWYNLTDNGSIAKSHNLRGDSLYGISLSVLPQSNKDPIAKLIEGLGKLIIKKRLKRAVFGARMPKYYKYAKTMSPTQYIFSKSKRGMLLDPELSLYCTLGIYPVRVIKEYFQDPDSSNYGVLVTWKNPYYKITKSLPISAETLARLWRIKIYKAEEFSRLVKKTLRYNND